MSKTKREFLVGFAQSGWPIVYGPDDPLGYSLYCDAMTLPKARRSAALFDEEDVVTVYRLVAVEYRKGGRLVTANGRRMARRKDSAE